LLEEFPRGVDVGDVISPFGDDSGTGIWFSSDIFDWLGKSPKIALNDDWMILTSFYSALTDMMDRKIFISIPLQMTLHDAFSFQYKYPTLQID
jgi:hypothetical protein